MHVIVSAKSQTFLQTTTKWQSSTSLNTPSQVFIETENKSASCIIMKFSSHLRCWKLNKVSNKTWENGISEIRKGSASVLWFESHYPCPKNLFETKYVKGFLSPKINASQSNLRVIRAKNLNKSTKKELRSGYENNLVNNTMGFWNRWKNLRGNASKCDI